MLDLERAADRVGRRQVDLVEDRHDLEVVLNGLVAVGERLGLNALRGVDQEHGSLAGRQRAGDLVAEVDMAGGVDQVEDVPGVHDPDVLGLDGDPPLPLDVHGVEVLLPHETGIDRLGDLENPVGEGGLAVVDMADDGEVANELDRYGSRSGDGGRHSPSIVPVQVGAAGRLARELGSRAAPTAPAEMASPPATVVLRTGEAPARRRPLSKNTEDRHVANIKSQIKRNRQNEKRRLRNKSVRAELRTRAKSAMTAAESGAEDSVEALRLAVKRIDKAAARGVIHKNTAANHKSRLVRRVAAIEAASTE